MKMFSVLLAWAEDDHEQGTFGWSGLAADIDDAEAKARKASAPHNNSYEDFPASCVNCGCTDNDGSDICPDCGGAIENPDETEFQASGPVLEIMEGVNYWAAPEMLEALQTVVACCPLETIPRSAHAAIAKATGGTAPTPAVTVAECMNVIRAIVARIDGRWNDPALVSMGALHPLLIDDCTAWGNALIAKAEGRA